MITKKDRIQDNPKMIGLLGIKPGVGVTHTGILLGEFLKEKLGAKVAFVEKNYHGDVEHLGEAVYGVSDSKFTFRGIDFYPMNETEELEKQKDRYDYLIFDFGTQKKKNLKELEQCEKKVIIGTLSLWEWQEYLRAAEYYKENIKEESIGYVVSLGNEKLVSKIEKRLRSRVCLLGPQFIGKTLSKEVEQFFYTLI